MQPFDEQKHVSTEVSANPRARQTFRPLRSYRGPVSEHEETSVIGLFPLDTVLVPGLVFPMHIFEPRYRQLLRDVLAAPDDEREFGIVATRVVDHEGRSWYPVGTTARVGDVDAYPDGRSDITTIGHRRFEVVDVINDDSPYLKAHVRWLPEDTETAAEDSATRAAGLRATALFARYRSLIADDDTDISDLPDDPHLLSFVLTAAVLLSTHKRQQLLQAPTTLARLETACAFLVDEIAAARLFPSIPLSAERIQPDQVN